MAKYNEKELADTSKFLSFVLRHKPEAIGIVLDRAFWAQSMSLYDIRPSFTVQYDTESPPVCVGGTKLKNLLVSASSFSLYFAISFSSLDFCFYLLMSLSLGL